MKLATIGIDVTALGVMAGSIFHVLPIVVTVGVGCLAMIYYGFVIFDRLKYGPELEDRMWYRRKKDGS